MKQVAAIIIFLCILAGCSENRPAYKCAEDVPTNEIGMLLFHFDDSVNYTDDDLLTLAEIKHFLHSKLDESSKKDSSKIDVQYYYKSADSVILDIYGIDVNSDIDNVSCLLFNASGLKLPKHFFLFFSQPPPGKLNKTLIAVLRKKNKQ